MLNHRGKRKWYSKKSQLPGLHRRCVCRAQEGTGIAAHDYCSIVQHGISFTLSARHVATTLGRTQVAVLQPFLKRASRPLPGSQETLKATPTYGDAVSKLEEAVALVDTLGCEVVFKEVREEQRGLQFVAAASLCHWVLGVLA